MQLDADWARRAQALATGLRLAASLLGILLGVALVAVCFNTSRLQVLTLREEIEAVAAASDEAQRAELASRIDSMLREERSVLSQAFRVALAGETAGEGPEAVEAGRHAAAALVRLRYLRRMSASLAGSP